MTAVGRYDKWHALYHRAFSEVGPDGWARTGRLHSLSRWLDRGREDACRRAQAQARRPGADAPHA